MNQRRVDKKSDLKRICIIPLLIYVVLAVAFYCLIGDQLHYRDSRGNIDMLPAEAATVELGPGAVVEQTFRTKIQRLKSVSIQWSTYYRANTGTATMELINLNDGSMILSESFDVAAISEGGITSLSADMPIEDLYNVPLLLRVYADSPQGAAASPLMSVGSKESVVASIGEDNMPYSLILNGQLCEGILCFSVTGEDYIWTGLHYWEFAAVGFVLLFFLLVLIWYRYKKRKRSYIINAVIAVKKYRFLIRQLVARDFKTKYKRSVLGMLWSFLNPLLTMCIQYFVFSTIFKNDIPNYAVYLLIGIVAFNFFSEACTMTLSSIVGNASLITKVYVPKYIYPLTRVMSSVINLGISLFPLLIVSMATGIRFHRSVILILYFLICLIIFSLGLSLMLSSTMVFFRDTQFLWSVLSMIWMYATPIFYPESILSDNYRIILQINPLYHFIKSARICILDGISPEPIVYVQCMIMALAALVIGAIIFRRNQDKFVLYL